MMIKVFDLMVCFFEGYMYFTLLNHFLNLRVKKKCIYVTIVGVLMFFIFLINQLQLSAVNLFVSAIVNVVLCQILFEDRFKKKIFYIVLNGFIICSCELFMLTMVSLPIGFKAIDYSNSTKMILMVIVIKMSSYFVIRFICLVTKNVKNNFFPSLIPYFSVFPLSCMVLYMGIIYSDFDLNDKTLSSVIIIVGCILLWISNIFLFVIYDRMVSMMTRVRDYELTEIKNNLEGQHYRQIEEINKKHSNIIHDMNNYLITIDQLAEQENNLEIVHLVQSLNNHIVKIEEGNYSSDYIINAILNGKKQSAHLKKIEYTVYVEPGFVRPEIEDIDLISILSNLLDNALEACDSCTEGKIDVQIYKANDGKFTTMRIKNNYIDKPHEINGEFITRKENPSMHGIGLHQVKSIVEKYGGWINIEYGENEFCVTIMFA